jgi:putative tryptophan/tyrosine transport system substrate-binding protein
MERRTFICAAVCALAASPTASVAQQRKVWRIGVLINRPGPGVNDEAFLAGMRDLGYVKGQDFVMEYRWGAGHEDLLPGLAAELVALKVDVILAGGAQAIQAAKAASPTIPVVITAVDDPVARSFVASLAHPGSRVTGLTLASAEVAGKRLQLLKEVVPRASRIAVLISPLGDPVREALTKAAKPLGIRLQFIVAPERAQDLESAFAAMTTDRAEALYVDLNPRTGNMAQAIVDLAARHRLPAIYETKGFVDAGGLVAYGPSVPDMYRRAAGYVDRIFKGAKPTDLPVQQPTKFNMTNNLKTARALGLAIPQVLLLRADELIE